jgi:hypothetical protein
MMMLVLTETDRIRLYPLKWLILHLNGPGRIVLWLLLSYSLAFAFVRWGDPEGSSKSWARNALSCLFYGALVLVTLLLIAVGSVERALKILAELTAWHR